MALIFMHAGLRISHDHELTLKPSRQMPLVSSCIILTPSKQEVAQRREHQSVCYQMHCNALHPRHVAARV